jgi:hypothetical protein
MASIPASAIVNVNPGVIAAGGTALDLSGLLLTNSTQPPIGAALSLPSAAAVSAYFGAGSTEAQLAAIYFNGFDNSNVKPAALLFAQYPAVAVPAYLRGGSLTGLTLAQLQALTGTVIITINGVVHTSGAINLSGATSFSNAATLIQTALASFDAVGTASITTTQMTVTGSPVGAYAVGQVLSGSGVTAGTKITALGTGTGGAGTYTVTPSQTAASTTISGGPTLVTFDSVSGAFVITGGTPGAVATIGFATGTISTGLKLTAATGAVTSQGAAAGVPGTAMDAIVAQTQDFASFATVFEPVTADKIAFALWTNNQDNRYLYVMWDTDVTVTTANNTASAGFAIQAANYSGTCMIYEPDATKAAFVLAYPASLDFTQLNGRTTAAFRAQSGLTADVTSLVIANQLLLNGYNFYGAYATANDRFIFLYDGGVSGQFNWLDTYVNQIQLNNAFQLAGMELLTQVKSIPYNAQGYALIAAAFADPINQALNFGSIRPSVTLSALQIAEINAQAGLDVATTISQRGWYLQVADANPTVRAARNSPPMTFWYTDGESVQKLTLASLVIQ